MTGKQLKQRREKAGLSRLDFAYKVGVAFNTVYRWETKHFNPQRLAIEKIEEVLGEIEKKDK